MCQGGLKGSEWILPRAGDGEDALAMSTWLSFPTCFLADPCNNECRNIHGGWWVWQYWGFSSVLL